MLVARSCFSQTSMELFISNANAVEPREVVVSEHCEHVTIFVIIEIYTQIRTHQISGNQQARFGCWAFQSSKREFPLSTGAVNVHHSTLSNTNGAVPWTEKNQKWLNASNGTLRSGANGKLVISKLHPKCPKWLSTERLQGGHQEMQREGPKTTLKSLAETKIQSVELKC